MSRRPDLPITSQAQLAALGSPVRQEMVDALSRMGASALSEIARALGRPADGLYYHVRLLVRVGILVSAGSRRVAGREEALFRTATPDPTLGYAWKSKGQARALCGIVASMLRLGTRDFQRALSRGGARVDGPRRELWALRSTGWLTPAAVAGLNHQIRGIKRRVSGPPARGRLYAVTILLTPLEHRPRTRARHSARTAKRKPR